MVVANENVYFGSGYSDKPKLKTTVTAYNISYNCWSKLLQYEYHYFSMLLHNSQLVLVGGCSTSEGHKKTGVVSAWDFDHQRLLPDIFPPMSVTCSSPALVSYNNWIIAAGGYGNHESSLPNGGKTFYIPTVQLLDTSSPTPQWHQAVDSPLPSPRNGLCACVFGSMCYFLGGYGPEGGFANKEVFFISLDDLITQVTLNVSTNPERQPCALWKTLPTDPPLRFTSGLNYHGRLLAIGGYAIADEQKSTAIHYYKPSEEKWVKVGDLPAPERYQCGCAVLPDGRIFVAGGVDGQKDILSQVDISSL